MIFDCSDDESKAIGFRTPSVGDVFQGNKIRPGVDSTNTECRIFAGNIRLKTQNKKPL